jgi:NhaA family Na+:H+ antiporter
MSAATQAQRPIGALTRFFRIETVGGVLLAVATIAALVLANSPWAVALHAMLESQLTLGVAQWSIAFPMHVAVNDGLMTVFFFTVGLEIRRELAVGELADARRAALPAAAALGGMIAPALLYVAFNPHPPARGGWGIPMATDIAFAVAALALLGARVAPALRVLLLALAILDDIGGVIVIAAFYSDGIAVRGLVVAGIAVVVTLAMQRNRIRKPSAYAIPALVVWMGLHHAGVHPTMAGVLMGLLTPPWPDPAVAGDPRSPAERLQDALHPWVALLVMPVFALANAGVTFEWAAVDVRIAGGVLVGLVVGKPLGVVAACWIAVRLGVARMPTGVGWRGVTVVGLVAGVGFTVALFIAGLALHDPTALASAKVGILIGSTLAVVLALVTGRVLLNRAPTPNAARTVEDAERSTER